MPTLIHLLTFLLIGLIAGWLAGVLTRGKGFGWVGNLIIGVVGALIGPIILAIAGFRSTHILGQIITAVIGALLLLLVINAINRTKR
jgi:uncharacterized membrane protein YeaQ/YmgE (transglycosylase-associated protein family)